MFQHIIHNHSLRTILSIVAVVITTISGSLFAQSVQRGIVYEYDGNKEKKPLANVEIVVNNAGSTVSDAQGNFTLNFRILKPGDRITIRRCEKLGYEVFNTEAVSQFVITRDDDPIVIVMCKSEIIKGIRDNYTKIARQRYNQVIEQEEQSIKTNLDDGRISQKEYERRIEEMKRHYEDLFEDIDNYIDRFTHIDLTEISELDQQVIDLMSEGRIEEAIRKYDDQGLLDTYRTEIHDYQALSAAETKITKAAEQKKEELSRLKYSIRRQIDLLWLAGGRDNLKKIDSLLKEVADAAPYDFQSQLDYAEILMDQSKTRDAVEYFFRASDAAKGDVVNDAKVRIRHGLALYKLNWLDDSMNECMTAIHNLDSLIVVHNDSDLYLYDKAKAHTTIARIFGRRYEHEDALRFFSYAIEEYKVLSDIDSIAYADDFADAKMRYSRELVNLRDTVNAEKEMLESISLYENLRQMNPQKNSGKLGTAYNWLGDLYRLKGNFEKSKEYLRKASGLFDYARRMQPDLYLAGYAECEQNMGKLYVAMKQFDEASNHLNLADSIFNKLAERNANMYSEKVAEIHLNKGTLYWHMRDYKNAMINDSIAVKRYEELYKMSASTYNSELSVCLYYLGDCYFMLGNFDGAYLCYTRAAKYLENPQYKSRLAQALRLSNTKAVPNGTPVLVPKDPINPTPSNDSNDKGKKKKSKKKK